MLEVVWFFLRDRINGFDLPVCVIAMIHRSARRGLECQPFVQEGWIAEVAAYISRHSYKYSWPMLIGLSRDARAAADLTHADIAASTAAACSIAARKC